MFYIDMYEKYLYNFEQMRSPAKGTFVNDVMAGLTQRGPLTLPYIHSFVVMTRIVEEQSDKRIINRHKTALCSQ